jgi:hypothetical protein
MKIHRSLNQDSTLTATQRTSFCNMPGRRYFHHDLPSTEDVRVLTLYTPPASDTNTYLKVSGTTAILAVSCTAACTCECLPSSARFKEYMANSMAAQLADHLVSFGVDGGQTSCTINSLWTNTP